MQTQKEKHLEHYMFVFAFLQHKNQLHLPILFGPNYKNTLSSFMNNNKLKIKKLITYNSKDIVNCLACTTSGIQFVETKEGDSFISSVCQAKPESAAEGHFADGNLSASHLPLYGSDMVITQCHSNGDRFWIQQWCMPVA